MLAKSRAIFIFPELSLFIVEFPNFLPLLLFGESLIAGRLRFVAPWTDLVTRPL
jgi:hypothetical protein